MMDHGWMDWSLASRVDAKGKIRIKRQGFTVKTGKMYATTTTDVKTGLLKKIIVSKEL